MENATNKLSRDILFLESERAAELESLKVHVHSIYENLRPINLLKNTFKEVTEIPNFKNGIGKVAIGITTGYLLKKLLFRSTANPIKKLAGVAFQTLVTNVATKNSDKIKEGHQSF